ncbi:hypothetical protein Athai_34130 [Actinocatenispora thailandica]|uniref:YCII-related domain-containing protein n=1 Tax=Actinocatenispora thailandica TaxID=227318 RepID=A0A7R7DQA3_9ACTN|nr:YciI family protein [Actinocatenispora thailandica]BCJ35910.1 hypothetical protein Athai_34130 [Actinocatenispora thailandica]
MSDPTMAPAMAWTEAVEYSANQGLLAKQLYVVLSEPTNGFGPVLANLEQHLRYQAKLEKDGVMFGAGPFAGADERNWEGSGMFIYRAGSLAQAREFAAADPMHACGARSYTVRTWLLNEGTVSLRMSFSGGRARLD